MSSVRGDQAGLLESPQVINRFRESSEGAAGIAGVAVGIEVIGATGEVMLEEVVNPQDVRTHVRAVSRSVKKWRQVPQQCRGGSSGSV